MTCKHCGRAIKPSFSKYDNGWTHENGNVYCKQNMAEPAPEAGGEGR
jgi:hypothetical protein